MKKVKRFISNMDRPLLIATIILFVFGLLNIVNASSQAVVIRYGTDLYHYFYRQLGILFVGFLIFLFVVKIPTKKYYKLSPIIYMITIGCLIYLVLFGEAYLGSTNWINLKIIKFQPSEFAKIAMIVSLSIAFEKFYSRLNNNVKYTRKDHFTMIGMISMIGIAIVGLVLLEKDLGTSIIIAGIFGFMFLLSPIQKEEKFISVMVILVAMLLGIFMIFLAKGSLLSAEQKSRLEFSNPCANYEEGGYQVCNGLIAINSGGLFGVGIGNSKQVSYLPESHTDSVFAIIAEEYGLIFCTIIFMLYIFILYRIFNLASKTSVIRNRYMCIGIGSYIALHIIINLGGIFASMPLTGVPLPFLSYGGSYTLSLVIALAIVQRICIEKNTERIKIK